MTHELVDGGFRIERGTGRRSMGEAHLADDVRAPEEASDATVSVTTSLRRGTGVRIGTGSDGDDPPHPATAYRGGESLRDLVEEAPRLPGSRAAATGTRIAAARPQDVVRPSHPA
ncbi:hypothetical protein U5640_09635 [Streptomyces sp. SS7]|uniref:hypothetical protein n=1 Tax=Streptomyces sp. SS7 TaxID=3108485 RepID=UPI0030EDF5AB